MTDDTEIIVLDHEDVDADFLYQLSDCLGRAGAGHLATRSEIERRNSLCYVDYQPKFTSNEVSKIGLSLLIHYLTVDNVGLDDYCKFPEILKEIADKNEGRIERETEIVGYESIHDEPIDIFDALAGEQMIESTDG